jgi:hypothetical protein
LVVLSALLMLVVVLEMLAVLMLVVVLGKKLAVTAGV